MSTQPASATPALQFPGSPDRLLNSREVARGLVFPSIGYKPMRHGGIRAFRPCR